MQFATARGWEDLSEILYAYEAEGIVPDMELAVQYIQMPSIARDFTNYYALYNKYRQVYHIDDILRGSVPKVTLSEFAAAPFDEKLAVMGLLLSRLSEAARDTRRQDALCTALYDGLSAVKARLPASPADTLREIITTRRAGLRRAADAGQDDKEQKYLRQAEINRLEEYLKAIDETQDADAQFDAVRELFADDTAKRESLADETGTMLRPPSGRARSWCCLWARSRRAMTAPGSWRSSAARRISATTGTCCSTKHGKISSTALVVLDYFVGL